jgi:hypothetical protein
MTAISCSLSVLRTISSPLERGAAEGALRLPGPPRWDGRRERFFRGSRVALVPWREPRPERRVIHWTVARAASVSRTSKLTAPDFERFARTPCPIAPLASSGMRLLSSLFARSCSRNAAQWCGRQRRTPPRNSRSHVDDADGLNARARRLDIDQVGDLPGLHTAPEFLFGRDQDAEVKRVYWHCDLDPDAPRRRRPPILWISPAPDANLSHRKPRYLKC